MRVDPTGANGPHDAHRADKGLTVEISDTGAMMKATKTTVVAGQAEANRSRQYVVGGDHSGRKTGDAFAAYANKSSMAGAWRGHSAGIPRQQ